MPSIRKGNFNMLSMEMLNEAAGVLSEVARETPIIASPKTNPNSDVYIKCENMQLTGSFKLRGAYYKIASLTKEEAECGIIACSAGNHAQGVALAAKRMGIKSVICMPEAAPLSKIEATASYGAEVVLCSGVYDDAYSRAMELKEQNNYTFIHPFNDEYVMAGQGTIGLELMRQLPDAEAVIVPVGGGGIISGIAYAIKQINPNCKVYGVQAEGAPSMVNSVRDGRIERLDSVSTIADGIAVKEPGNLTFDMVNKYVDGMAVVSEEEIAVAILSLMENHKIVAEGAGAVSVAAAMFNKLPIDGKKTVCIVSGGNVDVNILSRIINKALHGEGRLGTFNMEIADKPGQLNKLLATVANCGANIYSVNHDRVTGNRSAGLCIVDLVVETRNRKHLELLKDELKEAGYNPRLS